jgi:uncharacterized repeat protein (TIGR02543 family)
MKYGTRILIGVILSLAWTACDNFFQELIPPDDNRITEFLVDGQEARIGEDTISIPWQDGWENEYYNPRYSVSIPAKATLLPITDEHIKNAFPSIRGNDDEVKKMIDAITNNTDSVIGIIKAEKDFQAPGLQGSIDFSRQPVTLLVISGHGEVRRYMVQVMVTVTFNSNGGSNVDPREVIYGKTVYPLPPNPTKPFFNFGGWFTDFGLTKIWQPNTPVTGNITLYAGWNRDNEYTVFFHSNGDTDIDPITVTFGERVDPPTPPPYKEGHTFLGWYPDPEFKDDRWYGDNITSNIHLYAKWEQNKYTVTFIVKEGEGSFNDGRIVKTQIVDHGEKATNPGDPVRNEYNFAGWWDKDGLWLFNFDMPITGDTTLYAEWTLENQFDVVFKSGYTVISRKTVERPNPVSPPQTPTKEGHTFLCWSEYNSPDDPWEFSTGITRTVTLYATWKVNKYTITYESNGGSPIPESRTYDFDTPITLPIIVEKEGYILDGWYTDEKFADKASFDYTVKCDIKLYAKWVFTVRFETNGGNPQPFTRNVDPETKISDPGKPTRPSYTFDGWYEKSDFDCAPWVFTEREVKESMTLYARWVFTVTFETDGGEPKPKTQNVIPGGKVIEPSQEPELEGHIFGGWTDNPRFPGNLWKFAGDPIGGGTSVNSNKILYAIWIPLCTVTFDSNGGKFFDGENVVSVLTQPVTKGDFVAPPPEPVKGKDAVPVGSDKKTGLIFGGWFTDNGDFKDLWKFSTRRVYEPAILYARWIPVEMVEVSAGYFMMGSPDGDSDKKQNEQPQHKVTLTNGFYMGKYEVTQELYSAVMIDPNLGIKSQFPKVEVKWYEAVKFCNELSKLQGLTEYYTINYNEQDPGYKQSDSSVADRNWLVTTNSNANGYRLPTEAEWEYACRAGTETRFNTGNDITTNKANYNNSKGGPTAVGYFKDYPNHWGLYDMHGNVYEWCWDWYEEDYYKKSPGNENNPTGPTEGDERVVRGGMYSSAAAAVRSAARFKRNREDAHIDTGFRVVSGAWYDAANGKWEGVGVE